MIGQTYYLSLIKYENYWFSIACNGLISHIALATHRFRLPKV